MQVILAIRKMTTLQYSLIANDSTVKGLSFITLLTIESKRFINELAKIQV